MRRMRSIPACAGEPSASRRAWRTATVYPRVCGGTIYKPDPDKEGEGLSPRVRGNLPGLQGGHDQVGSIPACAGEPRSPTAPMSPPMVYPRVCGGTVFPNVGDALVQGLSPRVRGNRRPAPALVFGQWSIPACAGEPDTYPPATRSQRVYPRVCGGTVKTMDRMQMGDGLSPRVRGNLL